MAVAFKRFQKGWCKNMSKMKKRIRFWDRLRLRGRLLTLMLTVALTAMLICVVSFVVMNNRMLDSAHKDAQNLSDNVTWEVNCFVDNLLSNFLGSNSFFV